MTIHDDFDELASAYLDGEATADEVARVEADPELQAIVEELRGAAAAVSTPVTSPDEATRDAQIRAAIQAAGSVAPGASSASSSSPSTSSSSSSSPSNVTSLAGARSRRAERQRRMLSFAAAIAAVAVGGVIVWGLASSGDRTVDTATESAEITSTSADAAGDATDAVDAVEDAAEADVDDAMEDDGVTQQEAEIAEDEEAFEEEAMEEAMEEELEPEAATADDSTSENVEERLGDDDDAADESKTTETQGSDADIEIDLDQVFGYRSLDGETAGGDGDNAGLFPLPIEERTDFLGLATSTDELAEFATGNAFSNEVSPLGGSGCVEIAARLALAQSATLVGTARIIDDVTGQPADLAVVLLEDGGAPAPIAIDINECRIYLGADDLP